MKNNKDQQQQSSLRYLAYGAFAGMVARTATAPLDRAKVLQQVRGAYDLGAPMSNGVSLRHMLSQMIRWDAGGWRSMWKGNSLVLARVVPAFSLRYYAYDLSSRQFDAMPFASSSSGGSKSALLLKRLTCGGTAGFVATALTYPLDFVRLRWTMQTRAHKDAGVHYRSIVGVFGDVCREEGPRALYRGFSITCLGIVPYIAFNFAAYEMLRDRFVVVGDRPSVPVSMALGAAAGSIAMTATLPCDVLHKRIMVQGARGANARYTTIRDAIVTIAREEGPRAFFRGAAASYIKVASSQAVAWAAIELCKRYFG